MMPWAAALEQRSVASTSARVSRSPVIRPVFEDRYKILLTIGNIKAVSEHKARSRSLFALHRCTLGAQYLQATLRQRFFPELWDVRRRFFETGASRASGDASKPAGSR